MSVSATRPAAAAGVAARSVSSKRRQYFSRGSSSSAGGKRQKQAAVSIDITKGLRGFVVTCGQGKELQCQREVIAWLTDYADRLYPLQRADDGDERAVEAEEGKEDDAAADHAKAASVGSALQAELSELQRQQRQPRTTSERFAGTDSGVRGAVFIQVSAAAMDNHQMRLSAAARVQSLMLRCLFCLSCRLLLSLCCRRDDSIPHVLLLRRMLSDLLLIRRLRTRCTIRMHPLHRTAFSHMTDFLSLLSSTLAPFLSSLPASTTYAVVLNRRGHHSAMQRDAIIAAVGAEVGGRWRVDLHNPQLVVLVEVITRMCGVGVIQDGWQEMRQCNVRAIGEELYGKEGAATLEREDGKEAEKGGDDPPQENAQEQQKVDAEEKG